MRFRWIPESAGAVFSFFALIFLLPCQYVAAQTWVGESIVVRTIDGKPVTVGLATLGKDSTPVKHVIIYPRFSGHSQLRGIPGGNALEIVDTSIWMRAAPMLQKRGVIVAFADSPDDMQKPKVGSRDVGTMQGDMRKVAEMLKKKYPVSQLHMGFFEARFQTAITASGLSEIEKIVAVSSQINERTSDWGQIKQPVMMVQVPTSTCASAPYLEVQALAKQFQFALVKAGYSRQEGGGNCFGHHTLVGLESEFANAVADWLGGAPAPVSIGVPNAPIAWREEVFFYEVSALFGSNKIESTLLMPQENIFGKGPYPVIVFSHGDGDAFSPSFAAKARVRDMDVARTFLNLGLAVIFPARRGVGMSEGTYPRGFSQHDGDPTYKARVMAEDVWPVMDYIKTRTELDSSRIVLSGQSAGGYLSMYLASQNPKGVLGAIDFSGGRTDMRATSGPGFINPMMVNGFEEFGKTARIPTLWIFAENDSRYTAETIRASHSAFVKGGGSAELLLYPPIDGDGHFIYHRPALWRTKVKEFLTRIGIFEISKP